MAEQFYYFQWVAGYRAAKDGSPKEDNPYAIGTKEWREWLNGWCDYHEERPER